MASFRMPTKPHGLSTSNLQCNCEIVIGFEGSSNPVLLDTILGIKVL